MLSGRSIRRGRCSAPSAAPLAPGTLLCGPSGGTRGRECGAAPRWLGPKTGAACWTGRRLTRTVRTRRT